jgi:hypothetical protein
VNGFTGKTIAAGPKGTLRASSAARIVNRFFMRTSDNTVSHRDGDNMMFQQESLNLSSGFLVSTDVTLLSVPSFQYVSLAAFVSYDTNRDLRGTAIIRSVECNRRNRITAKALPSPFAQRVFISRPKFHVAKKMISTQRRS